MNWILPYQGTNACGDYTWTFVGTDSHDTGLRIGDVNDDGFADLFIINYYSSWTKHVWPSKGDGTGWTEDTGFSLPDATFWDPLYYYSYDGAELVDVNGDNLPDIIKAKALSSYTTGVYVNNQKEELLS